MAAAVLVAAGLHLALPDRLRLYPSWLYVLLVVVLLIGLVVGDPGRIDRQSPRLTLLTNVLVGLLTAVNTYDALRLVDQILAKNGFSNAVELLASGGAIWLSNVIVFALWYWSLDRGGAAARANGTGGRAAFVFPEMQHSEHVEPGWYPRFVDYLAYSFATATAFSPTDVSAIKPWAKLMMVVESAVSLVLLGLVIARAVNILQ